jgi:uncharacterized protein
MKRSCLVLLAVMANASFVFAQAPSTPAAAATTAPAASQPAKEQKPTLTPEQLKEKAEGGDAEAMVRYALMLIDGGIGKPDSQAGMAWLKKSAEKGNPAGMFCYGRALMGGIGGKPDMKAGLDWVIKAAKAGDPKACMLLFDNQMGTAKTPQQAALVVDLGEAAVKAGSQEGMIRLAMVYIYGEVNGIPIKQDLTRGISLLEKASEGGSPMAPYYLGHIYSANFRGVTPDYAKAFKWSEKAAERGNPMGMYDMAVAYGLGRGVEKDTAKAIELTKKAADLGHVQSMRQLEKVYRQGVDVEKNVEEADKWKKKIEEAEKASKPAQPAAKPVSSSTGAPK